MSQRAHYNNTQPRMAAIEGGGFVVVWEARDDSGDMNIYARMFDASGSPVGTEFIINSILDESQEKPSIAALPGGGFIVTWEKRYRTNNSANIFARLFDNNGNPMRDDFQVNPPASPGAYFPSSVALDYGRFMITWLEEGETLDSWSDIFACIFEKMVLLWGAGFKSTPKPGLPRTINQQQPFQAAAPLSSGNPISRAVLIILAP